MLPAAQILTYPTRLQIFEQRRAGYSLSTQTNWYIQLPLLRDTVRTSSWCPQLARVRNSESLFQSYVSLVFTGDLAAVRIIGVSARRAFKTLLGAWGRTLLYGIRHK